MKLLKLTVDNIKCFDAFVLEPQGRDMDIYGANGLGKTTIADCGLWLLFGKDSLGRKDFEIKPVDAKGEPIHFLDHRVEGVFEMAGGETLTLERTYKESWETQRGSSTKSFKGHETKFNVNGVPQTDGEYRKRIAAICDEEQFRLLTDPARFLALSWQDRRRMLFDVCGDMTDAEVIAASPELADLPALMGSHCLADFKKMTEAQRAAAKEERGAIPARIDEANRALPAEDHTDWAAALKERNVALGKLQNERSSLQAGGKAAELRARIVDIDAERKSIDTEYANRENPARTEALKAKRAKGEEAETARSQVLSLERLVTEIDDRLTRQGAQLTAMRAEANAERAKTYSGAAECPTCKRALPEEQMQAAVDEFNSAKARRLDAMVTAGKKLAAEHEALLKSFEEAKAAVIPAEERYAALQAERDAIVIPEDVAVDPLGDPRYAELGTQRAEAVHELNALTADSQSALAEIEDRIISAGDSVAEAQRGIAAAKQRIDGLVRVKELKAREKELSAQWESLERSLFLCEQFVRAKVRLLTERINERFQRTTFRLFREQINGGLTECCDVLWRENEALPSNGQSVQIGLDIINTLAGHLDFAPPIFVDNAESVTDLPATEGQQLRLVVSKGDKTLRIERDDVTEESAKATAPAPALF